MAKQASDGIRIVVEGRELDLRKDIPYPITYNIAELRDISVRKSSFSKTIQLPATKNNNKILGNIFDLQVDIVDNPSKNIGRQFNPKKRAEFTMYHGSKELLKGVMRLLSIVKNDGNVRYEVTLFAELTNFMSTLGTKKLRDLNLPELEHEYTKENITGSWDRNTDYVYPLIDYGVVETRAESFTVKSLKPAVYAKYYFDKIFEEAGYTYESNFIDSQYFKDMIIPFNREGIGEQDGSGDDAVIRQSGVTVSDASRATNGAFPTIPTFGKIFDVAESDSFGDYDTTNLAFTASDDYRLNVTVNLNYEVNYETQLFTDGKVVTYDIDKQGYTSSMQLTHKSSSGAVIDTYQDYFIVDDVSYTGYPSTAFPWEDDNIAMNIFTDISMESGDTLEVEVDNGNSVFNIVPSTGSVEYEVTASSTITTGSGAFNIEGSSVEGGTLAQDVIVPPELTQKQFILNILRAFNLYIIPDKDKPKHFKIIERDVFLETGDAKDWTDKMSIDSDYTIESLPDSQNESLLYTWKHDEEDFFLKNYKSRYDKNYGERDVDTGYEFNQNQKDILELDLGTAVSVQYSNEKQLGDTNIEIHTGSLDRVYVTSYADVTNLNDPNEDIQDPDDDFPRFERAFIGRSVEILGDTYTITDLVSPWSFTVDRDIDISSYTGTSYDSNNVEVSNVPFFYNGKQSKVIPAIYKSEDEGRTLEQYVSVPRILRYSKNIDLVDETYTIQDTPVEVPIIRTSDYQSYTETTYEYINQNNNVELSKYPFVSHVDDPKNPSEDLLFGEPDELFWAIGNYNPTDLYEDKHANITADIINENNKIITAKLDLTPLDIATFDFNDVIFINGEYYYINKIIDYDPNSSNLTKVEMLKKKLISVT